MESELPLMAPMTEMAIRMGVIQANDGIVWSENVCTDPGKTSFYNALQYKPDIFKNIFNN